MTETELTPAQKGLVQKLVKATGDLKEVIPDDLEPEKINASLEACCTMASNLDEAQGTLKPIIGRLLILAQRNPETFEKLGCKSFEDYCTLISKKTGRCRSNLREAMFLQKKWSDLPAEEYKRIGITKLLLVAKFTSQSETGHKKILNEVAKKTIDEAKEWVVEKGYLDKGETSGATLTITGSKKDIKEIREFLNREDIQAAAGTSDFAKILIAMTQEVESEWIGK
jgi:hypothetical protein